MVSIGAQPMLLMGDGLAWLAGSKSESAQENGRRPPIVVNFSSGMHIFCLNVLDPRGGIIWSIRWTYTSCKEPWNLNSEGIEGNFVFMLLRAVALLHIKEVVDIARGQSVGWR